MLLIRQRHAVPRALVPVLFVLAAASALPVSAQAQGAAQLAAAVRVMQQRAMAREAELDRRIDDLKLEDIFEPRHLVSPEGRAESRTRLTAYRTLLAEGEALQQTELGEMKRIIAALPEGELKRSTTRRPVEEFEGATLAKALRREQLAGADAADAILDWFDAQGTLDATDKRLGLAPAQQLELRALLGRLREAEQRKQEVVMRINAMRAKGVAAISSLEADKPPATR